MEIRKENARDSEMKEKKKKKDKKEVIKENVEDSIPSETSARFVRGSEASFESQSRKTRFLDEVFAWRRIDILCNLHDIWIYADRAIFSLLSITT